MATLGTAYVQIVPSAEGISGSISKVLDGESKAAGTSAGSNIGSFAKKAIMAAGIGTAVVTGVKAALSEGGALQQSYLGGLDTLYGDAAEAARAYAKEAAAAGISMSSYSEQAVSFGAALKAAYGGDTMAAAEAANTAILDMADNAAKMGTPLESIQMAYQGFARGQYQLLDNLKIGYGGTKEEMQRLLTDAQELTGVEYNIDNLGDVYEAIHVIQEDLGLTGVAADEASTTLTGSFEAMKAAGQNFLGSLTLGEGVSEAMSTLLSSAQTFFFGNLLPMIGTLVKSLPAAIGTFIQEGIPQLLTTISGLISSAATSITALASVVTSEGVTKWAQTTLPKFATAAGKMIGRFAKSLLSNLPKIVAALGRIGAAIVKGLGSALWGKVTQAAAGIRDRFLQPINTMKDKVSGIINTVKGFFPISVGNLLSGLKLPHISLSGRFSLNPPSVPKVSVSWYKKAEANPYMFGNATLFGAGERNDEILYGRNALMRDIREAAGSGGNVTINLNYDASDDANDMLRDLVRGVKRYRMAGAI